MKSRMDTTEEKTESTTSANVDTKPEPSEAVVASLTNPVKQEKGKHLHNFFILISSKSLAFCVCSAFGNCTFSQQQFLKHLLVN